MAEDIEQVVPAIEKWVNELINRCEESSRRAKESKKEVEVLKEHLREKDEQIAALESKMQALKVGKSIPDDEERIVLKRRVNELIKEVDRCIALLND